MLTTEIHYSIHSSHRQLTILHSGSSIGKVTVALDPLGIMFYRRGTNHTARYLPIQYNLLASERIRHIILDKRKISLWVSQKMPKKAVFIRAGSYPSILNKARQWLCLSSQICTSKALLFQIIIKETHTLLSGTVVKVFGLSSCSSGIIPRKIPLTTLQKIQQNAHTFC